MSKIDNEGLRSRVDALFNQMIDNFYNEAPLATYQRDNNNIDLDYFVRHNIETVLRIRHKRMIDALVVYYFTKHEPRLAKSWAHYMEDEMLHGQMFAKDIQKLTGLNAEKIYSYKPLFATQLLNGYFHFTLEHEGPMASIASAYFLEYVTRKTQPVWLDNLEKVFGKEKLLGARGHVNHDIRDGHNDFVWGVLSSLVKNAEDEEKLFQHFHHIYGLFFAYFVDVYQQTIGKTERNLSYKVTQAAVKAAATC